MSSMRHPKVLLLGSMYHKAGEDLLAAHADVRVLNDPDHEAILQAISTASAVWVRYPTRLRGDAIRKGRRLLVISTSGRGTDAVDIPEATERGIAVVNNPGLGIIPVSEHTVALMLDLAKQISRSDAAMRKPGGWTNRDGAARISLEGRTVGLIGLGTIGTEVARKCIAAFHMRALAYDPYISPSRADEVGAIWVEDLADMLREADFVSVHAELTHETRGMIGEAELRRMRPGAFLVNTARGPIVQHAALIRALREGWIRGAAIDVFDPEPPPSDSPLHALHNLVLTPHVAGLTAEAVHDLSMSAAGQILHVLRGERPAHLVNPEVWGRVRQRWEGAIEGSAPPG